MLSSEIQQFAKRPVASTLIALVRAYRLVLSPVLAPRCRYQPTCSAYALEALERHGARAGAWLAVKRLARCHPIPWLGGGQGFDPVPESPHPMKATDA